MLTISVGKNCKEIHRVKPLFVSGVSLALMLSVASTTLNAEMKHSEHHKSLHSKHMSMMKQKEDTRELVLYPQPMYEATLSNMREHLRAIHQVQQLVAQERYSDAADAVDRGLGMGHNHGAEGHGMEHQFMPEGMKAYGSELHSSALALSLTLRDAEVTEDLKGIFAALGKVTANCVACHDAYRLEPME